MVVILLAGPVCTEKETFAQLLEKCCGYKLLKVTKALAENLWDFKKHKPITDHKEDIIKETKERIEEAMMRWREDLVVYPIYYPESIEEILKKRSYFRILSIISPISRRVSIFMERHPQYKELSEDEFIEIDDYLNFEVGISKCIAKADIVIKNLTGEKDLMLQISDHETIPKGLFRPKWDVYFMELAHIVRQRSNCMKRR